MSDQKLLEATTMELLLEHEFTNQDELADWLNLRDWPEISEFDPEADNLPAIGAPGYVCAIPDDFPEELTEVYNLDPVTGAALLTGLAALLQYVSNKSDAKKPVKTNRPTRPLAKNLSLLIKSFVRIWKTKNSARTPLIKLFKFAATIIW